MNKPVYLEDLLDVRDLKDAIISGYVRVQLHPYEPYRIYNYTESAQYDRVWNRTTKTCRGLIVNERDEVIARPFPKFFNYGDVDGGELDLNAPVRVLDKLDGSLGILYQESDGYYAIATRGSFASEQAKHATEVFRTRYNDFVPPAGLTLLFEIIYPENRIVCDYKGMDDLVLLGAVDIETGTVFGPEAVPYWYGQRAQSLPARTLAEALALPPRDGAEGLVIRYVNSGQMVKIKQADYVALHAIVTRTSARSIWNFLAVDACKHLIQKPKHWGSLLGLDPAKAAEILKIGDGWKDKLLSNVPDEFHAWVKETIQELYTQVESLRVELVEIAERMKEQYGSDRKALAAAVRGLNHPHDGAIFRLVDGKDMTTYFWRAAYPEPSMGWGARSEDVA